MTRSLDVMLSKPGIYVVVSPIAVIFVEVEDGGRCHQLELASGHYERDGELRPGGWNVGTITSIEGPFGRVLQGAEA